MLKSQSQRATSQDQDGRATKKSARECKASSDSETCNDRKTIPATNDNLLTALKQARSRITSGKTGPILVPYNRFELESLVALPADDRADDEKFLIAVSEALAAFDDDSKPTFLELCERGFMFAAEDMESMWSNAKNASSIKRQEAVHRLIGWAHEDDEEGLESWLKSCLPPLAMDVFRHGDRGLAQIAHYYLEDIVKLQAGKRPREFFLFDRTPCLWKSVGDGAVKREISIVLEMLLGKLIDNEGAEHAKRLTADDCDGEDPDELFDSRLKFLLDTIVRIRNASGLTGILTFMANLCADADFEENLDSKPHLLGVQNGVVDLRTGELRARTPDDAISRLANCAYDPCIETRWFDDIVMSIMADDLEMTSFLRRFLGYCITGEVEEEIFTFFTNSGRNGKGLLMRSLSLLMGPLYAEMDTSIVLDKVGKEGDLAKGGGRRIWSFNETPSSAKLKSETVQLLSGGDGIPVKPAYSKSQTLKPRQKCIVSTNHLPELGGAMTTALESRLMIIRFPVVFKDLDPGEAESKYVRRIDTSLKQSIEDKLPVILKWLVDGSVDWYKQRLTGRLLATAPTAIQEATRAYKDEHDTLGVFLNAKCIFGQSLKIATKELLDAYNIFHAKDIGTRELASLMQGKGFQKASNVGRAKLNGYKGLKLYRPQ